jgi:hypothetical protein
MRISWTPGTGVDTIGTIVVMKADSAVTAGPTDGTEHAFSASFGAGAELGGGGSGNFVVYRGTGTQVDVTDLSGGTTYHVAIYAYAGSTTLINYQQDGAITDNQATPVGGTPEPTVQSSGVVFSSLAVDGQLVISWRPGDGAGSLVLMRKGLAVDADPADGTVYSDSLTFESGEQIPTGNYVVYQGSLTQITVTGLASDATHHVAIYEYNGSGPGPDGINYLQTLPGRGRSGHNGAHGIDCVDCHFAVGDFHGSFGVPRDADQESACVSCHNESGLASAKSDVAIHTGPKHGASVDCGSCHMVHNNYDFTTTDHSAVEAPNVAWIRSDTWKYIDPNNPWPDPALFQDSSGSYDPNNPPPFAFDPNDPPWDGICQSCHTLTSHHTRIPGDHEHNVTADCTSCHKHVDGFFASGDCVGCHNGGQGPRRQITESTPGTGDGEFGTDFRSHHVNDGTGAQIVTRWDCVVCHAEGDALTGEADGTYHQKDGVQLKDVDTGTAYSDWAGLSAAQRSDFCLSCHDADGATIISSRTADPNEPDKTSAPLNPFNDGITNAHELDGFDGSTAPHARIRPTGQPGAGSAGVLDVALQFDPLNAAHHAVLGQSYDPNDIAGWANPGVRGAEDCHYGSATAKLAGHGTANGRYFLRNANGNDAPTSTDYAVKDTICWRCHDPFVNATNFTDHLDQDNNHQPNTDNIYGIGCLNCHGGGIVEEYLDKGSPTTYVSGGLQWGGAHGVPETAPTFLGITPNVFVYGSALGGIGNWTSAGTASCGAIEIQTIVNNCTQHSRGGASDQQSYTRGHSRTYPYP